MTPLINLVINEAVSVCVVSISPRLQEAAFNMHFFFFFLMKKKYI